MPIETYCPNGHHLKTDESNAGKTGKCPVCKVPVTIPMLQRQTVSESAVVEILGQLNTKELQQRRVGSTVMAPLRPKLERTLQEVTSHLKSCPNCERRIDIGYQVCPHCRTTIRGLNDF